MRPKHIGLTIALSALLLAPSLASAQVCGRSVAVRVSSAGLAFIAEAVKPLVPTEIAVPDVDKDVFKWPISKKEVRVQINGLKAGVKLHDLKIFVADSALHLKADVDVTAKGGVTVTNPYVGFGTANCNADVHLKRLSVDIGAKLSTVGGQIKVDLSTAKIDLDLPASKIALEDCTLGDVLTAVINFVKKHFSDTIKGLAEKLARDKVPPLLQERLSGTIERSGELNGIKYTARLDGLATDFDGVKAVLGASLDLGAPAGGAACLSGLDTTAPQSCVGVEPQLASGIPSMFAAGISESLVQSVVHSAWRGGKMCLDSASLAQTKPELLGSLGKVGAMIGQPAGTEIAFKLRLATAPQVRFSSQLGAQLHITDLELDLNITPPNGQVGSVRVIASLVVAAMPSIDPESGTVTLDLRQAVVQKLEVLGATANSPMLDGLDPARLSRFIEAVGLPLLQQRLGQAQLSPSVIGLKGYLVELRQIQVRDGYAAAYLNVYKPGSTNDQQPPATTVAKAPNGMVGPGMVKIYVNGNDNETPAALLRYRYRVDNGKWSEPSYSRRIDVVVAKGGQHVVEIIAIDQAGNADATPARVTYSVDPTGPEIFISERPGDLVDSGTVTVRFGGSDNITPTAQIAFRTELFRVPDGGGAAQLLKQVDWKVGVSESTFDGLSDGVYRIRVTARDDAGNVSSHDIGFVVQGGGCSVSGSTPGAATMPLTILLLLGLLWGARWRRRR